MTRKTVLAPALVLAIGSLAACSDDDGARKSAPPSGKGPGQGPAASPDRPSGSALPAPKLGLKSQRPPGGEGTRLAWPTLRTTGVPQGTRLRSSGPITVRKRGAIIDGLKVSTEINVEANDVTIRNTQVVGAGQWAIIQRKGVSGLRVENSEVKGDGRAKVQYGIVNHGGMLTVRKVHVHTVSNGVNTDHGLIEESVIRNLKEFPGDHVTGIQSNSGPAPGLSLVIRRNVVLNPVGQTSAVSIYQDFGRAHDVTVDGNMLAGGGYSLYAGRGRFGKTSNIKVVRNVFSRSLFKKGGYYGPVTRFERSGSGNVWRDNIWEGTGKAVQPS
ncbi:hypothetical protein [Spirillospora sp. NPDC047279]|uniref:hypothetical protein n=1 Tax=Spirillospora sp. NPDC047279 TaxID=3155478 RepID=UPI0033E9A683